jgi:hypothetical protein
VVVLALLVFFDYGVCFVFFLVFFRFLCFLAGKHFREEPEGVASVVRVAGGTIWGVLVLSFFSSRSALFRHSLVDTRPPALLTVVLRFCRCLLRPNNSPLTGAWSARARGLVTPWAARVDHVSASVDVLGGVRWNWCLVAAGDLPAAARVPHAPSRAVHYSDDSSFFKCFPVLDCRLYLIVCSVLDLAWSLMICDRLHSASKGSYVNTEAHLC